MSSTNVLASTFAFSRYGLSSLTPAPVSKMMADFASGFRPDIDINLGVGYVNERTIPRDGIRAAFDAVLADPLKYKVPLNYGGPAGSENLRYSIRQYYLRNRLGGVTEKELDGREIIIGASGATSILEGIAAIFEPGIVITSDPQYYIYCEFLERMGYTVIAVPEDHSGVVLELLEKTLSDPSIRDSLRYFYFTTVSNPTSTVMSDERRAGVVTLAHRLSREMGRPVPVIFDKAYEELIHSDTSNYTSGMVFDQDGLVYEVGTVSKIASPSLRIGYLIGAAGPLINLLIQRTGDVGFSAPLISQEIMSCLFDTEIDLQVRAVNAGYRAKAIAVSNCIRDILGPDLADIRGGTAGFYYYLEFSNVRTDEGSDFFRYLTRTTGDKKVDFDGRERGRRVLYIPGTICVNPHGTLLEAGRRSLRLSYGFEEIETIESAIRLLGQAVSYSKRR